MTRPDPAPLLRTFAHLLPPQGTALDLACGGGRNAVFLARQGLEVTGIDWSEKFLGQARELARAARVRVNWIQQDLESSSLPPGRFDVITCFCYRDPRLYPQIISALRPGGLLFYETFTREQLRFPTGPRNPAHLLVPGELLQAFGGLEVLFYRETSRAKGLAGLIACKQTA